jgi:hypothetical protein
MNLQRQGNVIIVEGVIKSLSDAESLISELGSINDDTIILRIVDSFSFPSKVIGYLMKLKDQGKRITLEVGSDILYQLLDDLGMVTEFNVRKI